MFLRSAKRVDPANRAVPADGQAELAHAKGDAVPEAEAEMACGAVRVDPVAAVVLAAADAPVADVKVVLAAAVVPVGAADLAAAGCRTSTPSSLAAWNGATPTVMASCRPKKLARSTLNGAAVSPLPIPMATAA